MNYDGFALCDVGTENLHIFKALTQIQTICSEPECENQDIKIIKNNYKIVRLEKESVGMRVFCAEKHNEDDFPICGVCVSTLYSDDDYLK